MKTKIYHSENCQNEFFATIKKEKWKKVKKKMKNFFFGRNF
jgi:hypothetical protein